MKRVLFLAIVAASVFALSESADAAFMTYFGENTDVPGNGASNSGRADPTLPAGTSPMDAYNAMIASLGPGADIGIEDFEYKNRDDFVGINPTGNMASDRILELRFDRLAPNVGSLPISGMLDGVGQVAEITDANGNSQGRYPVTEPVGGTQYFDTNFQQLLFTIEFSEAVSAVGFFATDVGDFNGQIEVIVTDENMVDTTLVIPHTKILNQFNQPATEQNGALLYFGFTSDIGITKITLDNTDGVLDRFGFDNLVVATTQDAPEPASALLMIAGAGCLFVRRRMCAVLLG